MLAAAGAALLAAALIACSPGQSAEAGPDDWTITPVRWNTALQPHAGVADQPETVDTVTDVAFGMPVLTDDAAGGFWAMSSGSWLHIDADGATADRFAVEAGDPLAVIDAAAAISPRALLVSRNDGRPVLSVLDTATMALHDLPGADDDFAFGDVAVHDGRYFAVRYRPSAQGYVDYEVLRIDPADGARSVLFTAPLAPTDAAAAAPELPPVAIDLNDDGRVHIASPSARIVLGVDGAVSHEQPQVADFPLVAAGPDGTALWWGGAPRSSSVRAVTTAGSDEARAAISAHDDCVGSPHREALTVSDSDGEHPLPFLCGARAAVWSGGAWVVSIGGEGDGVLLRLRAPGADD